MRIAAYVRTSLGEKASDPARQYARIEEWAAKYGHVVVVTYEDRGGRRSDAEDARKRPRFQAMLQGMKSGTWDAIAVEETSRFGTKDHYQFTHYLYLLREASVQLWDAGRDKLINPSPDEMGECLTTTIHSMGDHKENVVKSSRSTGAKLEKAKLGLHQGGQPMACSAIECRTPAGVLLWLAEIVDGWVIQTYPDGRQITRRKMPSDKNREDQLRLVPSLNPSHRAAVKLIFESYNGGKGTPTIAHILNGMGHRTNQGKLWTPIMVRSVLRKGIHFSGVAAFGKVKTGKYHRRSKGAKFDRVEYPKGIERVPPSDWLLGPEQDYEPVISRELWDLVQIRLADRVSPKSPRNADAWLSGLLRCGGCGRRMTSWNTKRDGLKYACTTYMAHGKGNCTPNTVRHDRLVPLVERYLVDTCQTLEGVREEGWLSQLFGERDQLKDQLSSIRQAAEACLYERLGDFFLYEQGKGKNSTFRYFTIDMPGNPATLEGPRSETFRLPSFNGSIAILEYLIDSLEAAEHRQSRVRLSELTDQHAKLCALFTGELPDLLRTKLLADITLAENEMSRLRVVIGSGLGGQLRTISKQLVNLAQRVGQARRILSREDLKGKARALRGVLVSLALSNARNSRLLLS
jgi:DNA invertase Pin-like site-specific DNA recombinase